MYVCMYAFVFCGACMCVCMYLCMYAYLYVCVEVGFPLTSPLDVHEEASQWELMHMLRSVRGLQL